MERTLVSGLPDLVGTSVKICGWVEAVRDQKGVQFVIVRDSTGLIQVTHKRANDEELANLISSLTNESAVVIEGSLVGDERVKLGGIELRPLSIDVVGASLPELPVDENSSPDTRQDWRFIDLRRPGNRLIFEVQTTVVASMRDYWIENGFIEVNTPKLMGSPSESGAELFELDYFGRRGYLAQSPQFYKQMAMAAGFEKIFEIGPVFRADPSHTTRHMTEFVSVDMEMSWIEGVEDVMAFEEAWLKKVIDDVIDKHGDKIEEVFDRKVLSPSIPFPRISLAESREILKKHGWSGPPDKDLDPEGERLLSAHVEKEFGHEFVFVTDYPASIRPFYHMRFADRPEITKSYDLLWRGIEITTGAQREHRPDVLEAQAVEKGLSTDLISFYVDFFRYGCPPHGGFGFGLGRFVVVLLALKSIREATYLFRGPTRLSP